MIKSDKRCLAEVDNYNCKSLANELPIISLKSLSFRLLAIPEVSVLIFYVNNDDVS